MVGRAGEDRLCLYKRRAPVKQEARRKQLAAERREQRETRRTEAFTAHRGLQQETPAGSSRQQRLEEWKKRNAPKVETEKKKPAFIVGKITYNDVHLYRPPESAVFRPPKGVVPVKTPQPQRTLRSNTRNQQNRLPQTVKEAIGAFASAMSKASKKVSKISKPQPTPAKAQNNVADLLNRTFDGTPTPATSVKCQGDIFQFNLGSTAKMEIIPPVVFEKPLQNSSPISQIDCPEITENKPAANCKEPVQRRESKRNIPAQKDSVQCDPGMMENINTNEAAAGQTTEKSASYFRSLYSEAVTKLKGLCNEWTNLQAEGLPDAINDDVNVAVGYAQLLISQRLQQFEDLIQEHEHTNSSTELKVLTTDLDGFWGIVYNQVEDIYKKFEKLDSLKQNNWESSSSNLLPVRHTNQNNFQKPKIMKSKGNVTSGLRSFLAQARRQAKMGVDENSRPADFFDAHQTVEMPKPMSPVVMRVASRAKLLGSPKTTASPLAKLRSPLNVIPQNVDVVQTPKSSKATPARKRIILNTPGSTPLRRSTRLLQTRNE